MRCTNAPKKPIHSLTELSADEKRGLLRSRRGIISATAKACNVSRSLVSRVLHGQNTSARVAAALLARLNDQEPAAAE